MNSLSKNKKLWKAHTSKIIQSCRCFDKFLGPLVKFCLPLMKNVPKRFAKSVLIPLGLAVSASAADGGIQKIYILGSGTRMLIM